MLLMSRWRLIASAIVIGTVMAQPGAAQDSTGSVWPTAPVAAPLPLVSAGAPQRRCCSRQHLLSSPLRMPYLGGWWSYKKARHQDCWLGYADEFMEQPLGACVSQHLSVQRSNAQASRMVLHQFDFERNQVTLTTRGQDELKRIAAQLPRTFAPVVIERSSSPELDEQRRQAVFSELSRGSFPIPAERVKVDTPVPPGLRGVETDEVNSNLKRTWTSGGQGRGGGGAFGLGLGLGLGLSAGVK